MVFDGSAGVLIPSAPIYKIKRERVVPAALQQVVDDGQQQVGEGQMVALQRDLSSIFAADADRPEVAPAPTQPTPTPDVASSSFSGARDVAAQQQAVQAGLLGGFGGDGGDSKQRSQ